MLTSKPGKQYQSQTNNILWRLLPEQLSKVTPSDPTSPPCYGPLLTQQSSYLRGQQKNQWIPAHAATQINAQEPDPQSHAGEHYTVSSHMSLSHTHSVSLSLSNTVYNTA